MFYLLDRVVGIEGTEQPQQPSSALQRNVNGLIEATASMGPSAVSALQNELDSTFKRDFLINFPFSLF